MQFFRENPFSGNNELDQRGQARMWPATAFSMAHGSIQEKSSNLKFLGKRVRLRLTHVNACAGWIKCICKKTMNNSFSVYHVFIYLCYDQLRMYRTPLTLR